MTKNEIDYAVVKNIVKALAVICAANHEKVVDKLTGYLWDEEEAGKIKRSNGDYVIGVPVDCHCRSYFQRTGKHVEDCPCFDKELNSI